MEDLNVKVLDEVNKGTTMGMDAIKYVSEKVGDETFRKVLDVEYGKYKKIAQRVDEIYPQYSTKAETFGLPIAEAPKTRCSNLRQKKNGLRQATKCKQKIPQT